MSKPRLMFVAPSAYTLSGLAVWLDYLMPGLENVGWEVTLALVEGAVHHDAARYLSVHPWRRCIEVATATGTAAGRERALAGALRSIRPDLVASANIPDAYRAVQAMRARGEPAPRCVMTNHGMQGDLLADAVRYAPVLDAVIATNRLSCALFAGRGIPEERVYYAPYGVACPDRLPAALTGEGGGFRVLYSGRFEKDQKRVHDLPALLDKATGGIGSIHCVLAGGGAEEESLREGFSKLAPAVDAHFRGFVNPGEMGPLYRDASALVVTSSWEAGPLVVWEAMAQGTPVVTARYVGSGLEAALVDGENCLMFDVGDTAGAARALVNLATDPQLAALLRRGGFELVRSRYSHRVSVAAWDTAFRRALTLPALPRPTPPPAVTAGRLDGWLGPAGAECVRRMAGRRVRHADAGGEWPHTHSHVSPEEDRAFMRAARELDASRAGHRASEGA